jgi:hypothetical protein
MIARICGREYLGACVPPSAAGGETATDGLTLSTVVDMDRMIA